MCVSSYTVIKEHVLIRLKRTAEASSSCTQKYELYVRILALDLEYDIHSVHLMYVYVYKSGSAWTY